MQNIGLLILRLGIGTLFLFHGFPKISGGPEKWLGIGSAMGLLGIKMFPTFWGFMAAFSEFFGAIFVMVGIFFIPASALLAFTMFVAALFYLAKGDGLSGASHALAMLIVFVSLIFTGPGKYKPNSPF